MLELKNPDWTKTEEEKQRIWDSGDFDRFFRVEHQYPYQSRLRPIRRKWLNPFYVAGWKNFWLDCSKQSNSDKP